MRYFLLFIMTIGCVFSADLPREAQRELDSFNAAVAKADAIRQAAVNAAVDKAVKALNTVAKNADTAEERRAIDDEIFALKKLRKDDDLLGDEKRENSWLGKYTWWGGDTLEIAPGGVARNVTRSDGGTWVIEGGKLKLRWSNGSAVDTIEAPDAQGNVKVTASSGKTYVYTKLPKEKP